jgi:cation:H+ antiporter
MLLSLTMLAAGIMLIVKGADYLIGGSGALARRIGVSSLLVGLTVVAFGTSMPELAVTVSATLDGQDDLIIGNLIGSNIANIGLILGIAALIRPVVVQHHTVWKEIPRALLAVALVFVMANDILLDKAPRNLVGRGDGIVLLLFFAMFLYYVFTLSRNGDTMAGGEEAPPVPAWRSVILILMGLAGLVVGGKLAVDGAVGVAPLLGISQRAIGIIVVAVGTSLPELVTSAVAAFRKQPDIAIGNVVGSNIMNVFLALGLSATIRPIPFPPGAIVDALVAVGLTAALFVFMFVGRRHRFFLSFTDTHHELQRWHGAALLVFYFAYLGALVLFPIRPL